MNFRVFYNLFICLIFNLLIFLQNRLKIKPCQFFQFIIDDVNFLDFQIFQFYIMFKYFVLLLHTLLHAYYFLQIQKNIMVVFTLLFHFLCFSKNPQCYHNHCSLHHQKPICQNQSSNENIDNKNNQAKIAQPDKQFSLELQECSYCGLTKWIRMHHCHRCMTCVHKYDHHCVLLGICIGQKNQKFYLMFLWCYLYACFKQLFSYFMLIDQHITMDWETGYQHTDWTYCFYMFFVIFYFLATLLMIYLNIFHTHMMLYNDTTYERKKGFGLWYFQGLRSNPHPFDQGILTNLKLIFITAGNQPIWWWNPSRGESYKTYLNQNQREKIPN